MSVNGQESKKLNILALDTSSSWGSVSLSKEGRIVYLSYTDLRVTHSERLMVQIDDCLKSSGTRLDDVDLILVSNGPGSFTGLRIGLATAKGLSFAKQIPLYPVNTLKVLAYNLYGSAIDILPCIDARMQEVYAALYTGNIQEKIAPHNSTLEAVLESLTEPAIIIGDIVEREKEKISALNQDLVLGLAHQNFPNASAIIGLYLQESFPVSYDPERIGLLEPYYLRKSQAEMNFRG